MSTTLHIIIAIASLLAADAFFLPDCLWDVDSWDILERNSVSRRYRRFLWDDSDVCDWMCDPDLLPHAICNTCCRRSTATPRPPADNSPSLQSAKVFSQSSSSNTQPSNGMTDEQLVLPPSNVQLLVPLETPGIQPEAQRPQVGMPNNQNRPQTFQQSENWPQLFQQNKKLPQPSQQYPNWPQLFQQNQNWPQPPLRNQNWFQPPQQNQDWPQLPLQSLDGFFDNRIPFDLNGPTQVYTVSPLSSEPVNVQVPINLAGLFQAQVPSRLTTILHTHLPTQNGQNPLSSAQGSTQPQIAQNAPSNGNGGPNGGRQPVSSSNIEAVPVPTQSQSPQTFTTNGQEGSGIVVNWVTQPFSQPEGTQAQSQGQQTQQELLTDGQQQTQSATAPQQQFQTAGDQPIQPSAQSPQTQNQVPADQPVVPADSNGNGGQ